MSLAELDLSPLLQGHKLPAHEGVIERVGICGDEGPTPIHLKRRGVGVDALEMWGKN